MLYRRNTRSSVRMFSDDDINMAAISSTIKRLVGDYEVKSIEESFAIMGEFFLGTNLSAAERKIMVDEIYKVFGEELEKAVHLK